MKRVGSVVGPHIQLCRDILKDEGQLRQCRLSSSWLRGPGPLPRQMQGLTALPLHPSTEVHYIEAMIRGLKSSF
jgi:hypothetical protein